MAATGAHHAPGANNARTVRRPSRCAVTASVVRGDFSSTACSSVSSGRMP